MPIQSSVSTLFDPAGSQRERFIKFSGLAAAFLGILFLATFGSSVAAEPVEVSGELDVIIKEDFDQGRFEHDYFLRDEDGQNGYQLEFKQTPPGHLRSGQRIKVRGQPQGRKFQVERLDEQGTATPLAVPPAADQALNERKAVVLMVDLQDAKASARYTLAQITSTMYTGTKSVDGLYREASYGQVSFLADSDGNSAPDVFGPFAIPKSAAADCDYYGWAAAAESAAQAAGIDLSRYQHRLFVLPRYNDLPKCSWAGIANVGCGTFCRTWIAEGESGMVYAHELGHNLNMAHAGTDPENDGAMNDTYGDYSDPMGLSRSWHVFNAAHADQMGWYNVFPGSVATITASGVYSIAALGSVSYATEPQMLKVQKPNTSEFYYLSYPRLWPF